MRKELRQYKLRNYRSFDIVTAIESGATFPESMGLNIVKYEVKINRFIDIVGGCESIEDLLDKIRSNNFCSDDRVSFLKIFRRLACPNLDIEMAKKITKFSNRQLILTFGNGFKDFDVLKMDCAMMRDDQKHALCCLLAEYDNRGKSGYQLTDYFFDWFEGQLGETLSIEGPRGAGRDIELSSVFPRFNESCPCDFIIRSRFNNEVVAVGFARYDSTRGGAQSDDRTGGNSYKASQIIDFSRAHDLDLKVIFLSDGPGLAHLDTWAEALRLDEWLGDNGCVVTLITAGEALSTSWLLGI